ncbi:MAG TPA: 2-oxoglutarate dehydrogenase E1 component, partial [Thermomicrobiales bacterium]|nr:2-oxoglutarate dehydrogenase E1 component [Thermomicrobiales bacterium]
MSDLSAFYGPNAGYVLELYDRYVADPTSVDADTRQFFESFSPDILASVTNTAAVPGTTPVAPASVGLSEADVRKIAAAVDLANGIREYGHLAVQLDPLGSAPHGAPELSPDFYGITDDDLTRIPASVVGGNLAAGAANAAEAIARLREAYTAVAGFDFDHIQIAEERVWLRDAVESGRFNVEYDAAAKRKLLERLTQVEVFERYLHQTYLGQKRFSLEGNDVLIPMLDRIIDDATADGA